MSTWTPHGRVPQRERLTQIGRLSGASRCGTRASRQTLPASAARWTSGPADRLIRVARWPDARSTSWRRCRSAMPACPPRSRTSLRNVRRWQPSESAPSASTSTTDHRHQPRSPRAARGAGGMPRRRHARRYQARPARTLTARRSRDPRRAHVPARQAQPRRLTARPQRPRWPPPVQRARHGRRIRSRPDPATHPRRNAHRQGQGPPARQAAKLNPRQEAHLVALHRAGKHSTAELGDLFGVARSTVYRAIQREQRRQHSVVKRHGSTMPPLR
jgi:hypothetical protein